jgi:2-isopropylmalate synthase
VTTGINAKELFASSRLLTEITTMAVQANKAIVGDNAFAHEAGIHQDGMLKNSITYEIMTPSSVGVPEGKIVLGKHSGRHALVARCRALGSPLSPEQLEHAYILMTTIADRKKTVDDTDLEEIIIAARSKAPAAGVPAGPA